MLNMLRSGEPVLQKEGLKALGDLPLPERGVAYDAVAERLRAEHDRVGDRSAGEDALAWHAKALGQSGDRAYEHLLEQVADEARSAKVRKHARQALDAVGD